MIAIAKDEIDGFDVGDYYRWPALEEHATLVNTLDQALRVFDREHWRGRAGFDRVDRQRAREDFDAISQRATPGFSAVVLGL